MEKRGGQAARGRKKTSTQPAFDPQGWMDGGKEGKRMQEVVTQRVMTRPPVADLGKCRIKYQF